MSEVLLREQTLALSQVSAPFLQTPAKVLQKEVKIPLVKLSKSVLCPNLLQGRVSNTETTEESCGLFVQLFCSFLLSEVVLVKLLRTMKGEHMYFGRLVFYALSTSSCLSPTTNLPLLCALH